MRILYAARSDVGLGRENNEDAYKIVQQLQDEPLNRLGILFALADGLGGHPGGEVASKMACNAMEGFLDKLERDPVLIKNRFVRQVDFTRQMRTSGLYQTMSQSIKIWGQLFQLLFSQETQQSSRTLMTQGSTGYAMAVWNRLPTITLLFKKWSKKALLPLKQLQFTAFERN